MENSTLSSGAQTGPRIVQGLYLGADALEDGWQPLPTSFVESVDENCAQEDMLVVATSFLLATFTSQLLAKERPGMQKELYAQSKWRLSV